MNKEEGRLHLQLRKRSIDSGYWATTAQYLCVNPRQSRSLPVPIFTSAKW